MIVALAGHVDHGKTSIVRALTGVDTDRLAEEKRRGLTIDLGFAYVDLGGTRIGFVDVPGHRRFIHNMVAGIARRQYALLVVAADDGVMPQTREHLQILKLLGLARGAIALNKIDRAEPQRIDSVRRAIGDVVAGSFLEGAAVLPLSCETGEGIDALRAHLGGAATAPAAGQGEGPFRLAIDRAFTVRGSGAVVTGTVVAGEVRVDDRVALASSGAVARVRGLHVQDAAAEAASSGDRAAVNLAGIDARAAARGDWLCTPAAREPIGQFALRFTAADDLPRPLRHNAPLHVYHGASHREARALLLDGAPVPAGGRAIVDLACMKPLHVKVGDRVVLRDHALERTIGGGQVLDVAAAARRRAPKRRERLGAIRVDDWPATLAALARSSPVAVADFARRWNLDPQAVAEAGEAARLRRIDGHMLHAELAERVAEAIRARLAAHHRTQPASGGLTAEEIGGDETERLTLTALLAAGELRHENGRYRLAAHRAVVPSDVQRLFGDVYAALDSTQPPSLGDIAKRLRRPFAPFERQLRALPAFGLAVRVGDHRYYLPARLLELADAAIALDAAGAFTVRDFRDATGVGRNVVIEVLEHFDARGFTRREGDARRVVGERASVAAP